MCKLGDSVLFLEMTVNSNDHSKFFVVEIQNNPLLNVTLKLCYNLIQIIYVALL